MTDHKKEALAGLDAQYELPIDGNLRDRYIAEAHVQATLYLAEQQRIANLIALSQATDGSGWQAEEPLDAIYEYEAVDYTGGGGDNGLRIRAEIREGLGLA